MYNNKRYPALYHDIVFGNYEDNEDYEDLGSTVKTKNVKSL